MEQHVLTEENLQDVTGGLDRNTKIGIGVGAGTGAVALGAGALALVTRKPRAVQQAGATGTAAVPKTEYIRTSVARTLSAAEKNSSVGRWLMNENNHFGSMQK